MSTVARAHTLERTSPLGGPFVGRCILCGAEGLPMRAAAEPCENPAGVTEDGALLMALEAGAQSPERGG